MLWEWISLYQTNPFNHLTLFLFLLLLLFCDSSSLFTTSYSPILGNFLMTIWSQAMLNVACNLLSRLKGQPLPNQGILMILIFKMNQWKKTIIKCLKKSKKWKHYLLHSKKQNLKAMTTMMIKKMKIKKPFVISYLPNLIFKPIHPIHYTWEMRWNSYLYKLCFLWV